MNQQILKSILDTLNAASADICASVLMTKEGLVLVGASPQAQPARGYDEDRISALSASILLLGHKFMDEFVGDELDQVLIKSKGGYLLAILGKDLALTVLAKPYAESGLIFSQMALVVDNLMPVFCEQTLKMPTDGLERVFNGLVAKA